MPWYKRMNWGRLALYLALLIGMVALLDPENFFQSLALAFVCSYASEGITGKRWYLEPKREVQEPKYDPYDKRIW